MVAVFGATGSLGRDVCARLARSRVPYVVVGRDRARLDRLAASLAHDAIPATVTVADIADPIAVRSAVADCRVLVNCAPADVAGLPLIRAALDAGMHYVDAAGEQGHIRHAFDTFSEASTRRRIVIVPALGFDYAVGDCLASLAARGHHELVEIVVAYAIGGADVSGNSARAAASSRGGQEVVYRNGRWTPVPFEMDRHVFEFPPPIGRRQMSRYGSGEVVTVPRHLKTRRVTTLITTTSLAPHAAWLPVFPVLRPLLGWIRTTPARAVLGLAANLAVRLGRGPAAPTESHTSDHNDRWFSVVAEARTTMGTVGRAVATGGNFHEVTAAILAQGAVWLFRGTDRCGVHSPATAFDAATLLDSLTPDGVRWTHVEPV